jgi:hypothetical protein
MQTFNQIRKFITRNKKAVLAFFIIVLLLFVLFKSLKTQEGVVNMFQIDPSNDDDKTFYRIYNISISDPITINYLAKKFIPFLFEGLSPNTPVPLCSNNTTYNNPNNNPFFAFLSTTFDNFLTTTGVDALKSLSGKFKLTNQSKKDINDAFNQMCNPDSTVDDPTISFYQKVVSTVLKDANMRPIIRNIFYYAFTNGQQIKLCDFSTMNRNFTTIYDFVKQIRNGDDFLNPDNQAKINKIYADYCSSTKNTVATTVATTVV